MVGPDDSTPLVEAIRSAIAKFNAGDLDGYLEAFTPDCRRGIPGGTETLALPDIRAGLELVMQSFDGLHLEEVMLFGQGRHVCAWWRMVGTHTAEFAGIAPTQRTIAVDTAEIYEFEADGGGRVCASWSFGDPTAMFTQISS